MYLIIVSDMAALPSFTEKHADVLLKLAPSVKGTLLFDHR
jgi:hypothetical protein